MQPSENSVFSPHADKRHVDELFEQNCVVFLLPNRFEDPAWLNEDSLTARARRMQLRHLKGHSDRTVINYSPLHDNENWLFDLAYDFSVFELKTRHITVPVAVPGRPKGVNLPFSVFDGYSGRARAVYDIALRVVQAIIPGSNVRFGIGTRNHRVVSIMEDEQRRVPNIFQLSSGEVALLNMFLSVLRDFDLCEATFTKAEDVRGIVVVDEIDLHLHAVHQHDVLPKLVQMFPRVQFIITTHSPLFVLGLHNALKETGFALYRLPHGQQIAPEEFGEFGRAYQIFTRTSTHIAEMEARARAAEKPLVFVDGTTDIKYFRRAAALLGWHDSLTDVEVRDGGGDANLKKAWKTLTTTTIVDQTVVLLHDCDSDISPREIGNIFRRKIPLVEDNPVHRGLENLFDRKTLRKAMAHKPAFVDIVAAHEATVRGRPQTIAERWQINEDEKSNLCNWLCENGTIEDFRHFDRIRDELGRIPAIAMPLHGSDHDVPSS